MARYYRSTAGALYPVGHTGTPSPGDELVEIADEAIQPPLTLEAVIEKAGAFQKGTAKYLADVIREAFPDANL